MKPRSVRTGPSARFAVRHVGRTSPCYIAQPCPFGQQVVRWFSAPPCVELTLLAVRRDRMPMSSSPHNTQLDVSFILVTYDSRAVINSCIGSILQQLGDLTYEIIVVDNASSDGTATFVEAQSPSALIIRNQHNIGFGRAANIGYSASRGKYAFFLNPDATLHANATRVLFEFMERPENGKVFACGGRLLANDGVAVSWGHFPSLAGMLIGLLRADVLLPRCWSERLSAGLPATGEVPYPVDYVCGAALLLRGESLAGQLPFDEEFFMYFEETEMCHRMRQRGLTAMIVPGALIQHTAGRSSPISDAARRAIYEKSKLTYFTKCKGKAHAAVIRWLYRIGYAIRYAVARRANDKMGLVIYWQL